MLRPVLLEEGVIRRDTVGQDRDIVLGKCMQPVGNEQRPLEMGSVLQVVGQCGRIVGLQWYFV